LKEPREVLVGFLVLLVVVEEERGKKMCGVGVMDNGGESGYIIGSTAHCSRLWTIYSRS
jgi:presenilin-like A22 family membrane protease